MRARILSGLGRLAAIALLLPPVSALATEPATRTCAARVAEAEFELEDLREIERIAPMALEANQAVHDLLEPLWRSRSTERLRYLAGRHARDRSRVELDRAKVAARRGAAKLEVLQSECLSGGDAESQDRAAEALARYVALACSLIGKNLAIAKVDRSYRQEVLDSVAELRSRELATAQELIQARYELKRSESQLSLRRARQRQCGK